MLGAILLYKQREPAAPNLKASPVEQLCLSPIKWNDAHRTTSALAYSKVTVPEDELHGMEETRADWKIGRLSHVCRPTKAIPPLKCDIFATWQQFLDVKLKKRRKFEEKGPVII